MKHTISVLVENRAGVLARITGLFARRGFNIDSLAVSVTEDKTVSRITIAVDGSGYTVEQIEKQLNKLIDVIKVKTIRPDELICRELMLCKVGAAPRQRAEVVELAKIVGAEVAELTASTLTLTMTDSPEKLDRLIELVKPYGIRELVRTGIVALERSANA